MGKNQLRGRTVTLKIKYKDFSQQTRSKSLGRYLKNPEIVLFSEELLKQETLKMPIRLMGLGVSNLEVNEGKMGRQLTIEGLFMNHKDQNG